MNKRVFKMEEENQSKVFDYCDKVDLHALDPQSQLDTVVAVASEHNFRGIVVDLGKMEQLTKEINRPYFGDKSILPICAIDYPFGNMSLDVRNYSILAAKEKGAKEVEIVAPYYHIVQKDFRRVYEDAQNLINTANKCGISLKYVIDQNSKYMDDGVRAKMARIASTTKIQMISLSLGYFDKEISHTDNIIRMRNFKSKADCLIKVYSNNCGVDDLASYVKAGVDIFGLDWKAAPNLIHAYENMVQKGE